MLNMMIEDDDVDVNWIEQRSMLRFNYIYVFCAQFFEHLVDKANPSVLECFNRAKNYLDDELN